MPKEPQKRSILPLLLITFLISGIVFSVVTYLSSQVYFYEKYGREIDLLNKKKAELAPEEAALEGMEKYCREGTKVCFEYPQEWQAIEEVDLPEGPGVAPVGVRFVIPRENDPDIKVFNDFNVTIYRRGDADKGAFQEIINQISIDALPHQEIEVAGTKAKRWDNVGGIASNPTEIQIVKNDSVAVFIRVEQENQDYVGDGTLDQILETFEI